MTEPSAGPLVDFYRGHGRTWQGYTVERILQADDAWLEETHDYVQWLFPLRERSAFMLRAPRLDDAQIDAFRGDEELRKRVAAALDRMLAFYGFEPIGDGPPAVVRAATFEARARNGLTRRNHNHLRLTRIIRSLRLLGLEDRAQALFGALEAVYAERPDAIGETTFAYWRDAAR